MFQNSNPPKPPFGLEGRGSYVWVPYDDQDKNSDNASLEEQQADADVADDIAEEHDISLLAKIFSGLAQGCARLYNQNKTKSCKCYKPCRNFDKFDFMVL
jgi:hypothetical protein